MEKGKEKSKDTGKLFGKVARLPKNYDAVHFMENIKIPYKNKVWYILVEKQDNELHCIKYNQQGKHMNQFMADLKAYYIKQYKANEDLKKIIESIHVVGNEKFSVIKNIANVEVGGKKMITRIAEDLIKLLK